MINILFYSILGATYVTRFRCLSHDRADPTYRWIWPFGLLPPIAGAYSLLLHYLSNVSGLISHLSDIWFWLWYSPVDCPPWPLFWPTGLGSVTYVILFYYLVLFWASGIHPPPRVPVSGARFPSY